MRDVYHRDLVEEARAERGALHNLGERIQAMHSTILNTPRADFDALRREFAALHEQDLVVVAGQASQA